MQFIKRPLGIYQANCYVIIDEETKSCAVIDPGGDFAELKSMIEEETLQVKYIILTHGHGDHIGAVPELKQYTGAQVLIHQGDADMLRNSKKNHSVMIANEKIELNADQLLEDKEVLKIGNTELEVIHTPGHSQGSICIRCGAHIFSGDTLFACSIGRTDLEGGSFDAIIESIKDKLLVYPDETRVYPGHGPATTILTEKKRNPFLQ